MQPFEITILGCSSATPTANRNPSAQVVYVANRLFLVDCGEGTQMQLRKYKIKFQKIDHILISHLHGDHYFGLMGLLSSMHLLGRKHALHLYAPAELKSIIDIQLKYSQTYLNYELVFHAINSAKPEILVEDERLIIKTIILNHRISCTGFLFKEKELPKKINKDKIVQYNIPDNYINLIKLGNSFTTSDGQIIDNAELTSVAHVPRSYAYCSDTCYLESVIEDVKGVDLLYHESTFMHDMQERAKETFHSTTIQAATVALKSSAKRLVIGHFSARYRSLVPLLDEAKTVFENTILAKQGEKIVID
ncbi:MAG: ribonuclease Z [Bacteroidetes bacterium]|nr:ribonuclease Z [Bacteroidota bacterium]